MVKVVLEVREGATPFRVAVEADGITQALGLIERRYPGGGVQVVFPIDPEEFFTGDRRSSGAGRERSVITSPRTRDEGFVERPRGLSDPTGELA